jgi:hypothetical protein
MNFIVMLRKNYKSTTAPFWLGWLIIGLFAILLLVALANSFLDFILTLVLSIILYRYYSVILAALGLGIFLVTLIITWVILLSFVSNTTPSVQQTSNNVTSSLNETSDQTSQTAQETVVYPSRKSSKCSISSQTALPANWPSDFTLYPGGKIVSVKCAPTSADLYEVRVVSNDDVATVASFFESKVSSEQWSKTTIEDNSLYDTFTAYKMLNAYKKHEKSDRQMILDIRSYKDKSRITDNTEIIYREREW